MPGRLTRRPGRALLVAEAPPRGARPGHRALDGPAGDRLGSYLRVADGRAGGWSPAHDDEPLLGREYLLERFDTVNLLGRWPGGNGKGAAWPTERARRAAARLPLRGVVVLVGLRVQDAYRALGRLPAGCGYWFWRRTEAGAWVTTIPHPSGVNHLYNEPATRELAGWVLREAEGLAALVLERQTRALRN